VPLSFHFSPSVSLLFSSPLREFCIPQPPGMFYVHMLHVYMCVHAALCAHTCTHGTVLYDAVYIYSREGGHAVLYLYDDVYIYYIRCEAARHCAVLHCTVSVSVFCINCLCLITCTVFFTCNPWGLWSVSRGTSCWPRAEFRGSIVTLGHPGNRSGGDFGHFRNWDRSLPDLEKGGVPFFGGPRRRVPVGHLPPSWPGGGTVGVGGGAWGCGGGVGGRWFRFWTSGFRI
jgi:hypothetical protein